MTTYEYIITDADGIILSVSRVRAASISLALAFAVRCASEDWEGAHVSEIAELPY